jgi:hypothetical protein
MTGEKTESKEKLEPPSGLEPETSSLPMKCSTTELWRQKILKNCEFHRYKNLFLAHLYLDKIATKKFLCLELLVFEDFSKHRSF